MGGLEWEWNAQVGMETGSKLITYSKEVRNNTGHHGWGEGWRIPLCVAYSLHLPHHCNGLQAGLYVCVCVCVCVCASAASYGMAHMKEASVVNGEWAAVNAVQVVQARCEQMWCEGEWEKHYMCS